MCSSQAIVTSNVVKSKELFISIVKILNDEEEKDEKERKDWKAILNCIILTISEDDYKRMQSKFEIHPDWLIDEKDKKDPLTYYLAQLEKWGNVPTKQVLEHFAQLEEPSLENLQKELKSILEKIEEEDKEYK